MRKTLTAGLKLFKVFPALTKLQNVQKAKSDDLQKKNCLSCKLSEAVSCPLELRIRRSYFSSPFVFLPI
jgi:hypothetical protein